MREGFVKSSVTGAAQVAISTLLAFVTIPIFVRLLGPEAFGVFSLVALVGSVNIFANLGLNASLVRFLALQGKSEESDHDIVVNMIILLGVLFPLTIFGIVFRNAILVHVLNVPNRLTEDAAWLFVTMLIGNVFLLVGQTFTAILDSLQKVYLTNLYQMMNNIVYWGLILLALSLSHSLKSVAIAVLVSTMVWFSFVVVSAIRSWGRVSLSGFRSNALRVAKKQLHYGLQIYSGGLISFFYEPLTKILVSKFLGVTEVGLFDIGLRVRNQVVSLAAKLIYPLYPALSKTSDEKQVRTFVHDVEQKILLAAFPFVAILVVIAKPLVSIVFRVNIDAIAITVAFIASAWFLGSVSVTPIYLFLMAKGHADKTIIVQGVNVVVNAAVFLLLINWLGYYAVVAANVTAIFASSAVLLYYQKRFLDSLVFESAKQAVTILLSFLVVLAFAYFIAGLSDSRVWQIVSVPIAVILATTLLYRQSRLIHERDIHRYFGDKNILSRMSIRILTRG